MQLKKEIENDETWGQLGVHIGQWQALPNKPTPSHDSVYFIHGHKPGIGLVHSSSFPQPPAIVPVVPEHEMEAHTWSSGFRTEATAPQHLAALSFARGSGSGGQVKYPIPPRKVLELGRLC